MATHSAPVTAEEHRKAVQDEYGTYVCVEAIDLDGVRAFNVGDAVPVSHVKNDLVPASCVAKTSSKAAAAS